MHWQDMMSSVKLSPGCCVMLFEHEDFHGSSEKVCESVGWIGDKVGHWWNDKLSSFKLFSAEEGKMNTAHHVSRCPNNTVRRGVSLKHQQGREAVRNVNLHFY